MTLATTASTSGPYNCNGVTTAFSYAWKILDDDEIEVTLISSTGVRTTLTKTTHYTVSGVGSAGGGTVTALTAYATGYQIYLRRKPPLTQTSEFQNQGSYNASAHEEAFDKLAQQVQFVRDEAARAFKVSVGGDEPDPVATFDEIVTAAAEQVGEAAIALVEAEGTAQVALVGTEGDAQVAATQAAGDDAIAAIAAVGTTTGTYGTLAAGLTAASSGQEFQVLQSGLKAADLYEDVSGKAAWKGVQPIGDGVELGYSRIQMRDLEGAARPIVELDMIGGIFSNGRYIPSVQSPRPTRNKVNVQEFLRSSYVTANYSGDYHRVLLPTSGDVLQFGTLVNGRGYRLKCIMKSTSGAGSQTVPIGSYPSDQASVAITEGADVTHEANYTGASSRNFAIGVGPLDLLVKFGPWVDDLDASIPTDDGTNRGTFAVQQQKLSDDGVLTFTDGALVGGTVARIMMTDTGGNYSWAAGTIMVALRKDGPLGGGGVLGGVVFTPNLGNTDYDDITLGGSSVNIRIAVPGCGGAGSEIGNIEGEDFVVLGGTFNASASASYFEGVEVATGTGTGGTALSFPYLSVGGTGYTDATPWDGLIGPVHIWNRVLSASEYRIEAERLRAKVRLAGGATQARRFILFAAGNSIPNGFSITTSFIKKSCDARSPTLKFCNHSVNGSTGANYLSDTQATVLRRIEQAVADGFTPIFFYMHGQNEPNTTSITPMVTACDNALAAGAIVIIANQTSNSDTTYRPGRTTAIAAYVTADTTGRLYLLDIAANATMGANGAYSNGTYFLDGVHPTQTGSDFISGLLDTVLDTIYAEH